MKILTIYDSVYGNTKQIAEAIGSAFAATDVKVVSVSEAKQEDLEATELVIVGTPTHGGRAKPALQEFLNRIPAGALAGKRVAAFDTRFAAADQNLALRLLMKVIDFAAPRIAKTLAAKGGKLAAPPEGFIVTGKEGPLKDGELERAAAWAKNLIASNAAL